MILNCIYQVAVISGDLLSRTQPDTDINVLYIHIIEKYLSVH